MWRRILAVDLMFMKSRGSISLEREGGTELLERENYVEVVGIFR